MEVEDNWKTCMKSKGVISGEQCGDTCNGLSTSTYISNKIRKLYWHINF